MYCTQSQTLVCDVTTYKLYAYEYTHSMTTDQISNVFKFIEFEPRSFIRKQEIFSSHQDGIARHFI